MTDKTRSLPWPVLFSPVLMMLWACSEDPEPTPQADQDASQDAGERDASDPSGDMGPDIEDSDAARGAPCDTQQACGRGQVCDGTRHCASAPACERVQQTRFCEIGLRPLFSDSDIFHRAYCDEQGFCALACERDEECAQGQICTDNGKCQTFEGTITGEHPGDGARDEFFAGVGNVLMKFPIGLPLGGYGSRASSVGGRYAEALKPSKGQMHGLYARALLLDNGARQLALVRLPIIFPTASLHEAVARRLQEKTGRDWRDSLVLSGTHTHSGPGRFLQLPKPENAKLPLGSFGTDNFHDQAFAWMVDSVVESIEQAMADRSEARLGWEIVEAFDTDDAIASDRWGETPPFDDNRLLLMRIDDESGEPRALLFSLGIHGTFNESDYATGDSIGGLEHALEQRFGQRYDRFVPTLFFNQNGGTMSPRGDQYGHRDHQKVEHIGARFVERMWSEIEGIETDRDVELQATTMRFPLGYDTLGYAEGEWTDLLSKRDLVYGGIGCSVGEGDGDYETHHELGRASCLGLSSILYNRPPSLFLRSQMTALSIDGLTIVTLPGEAAMELGWQVLRDVQEAHGVEPLSAWTLGYAQDHQFYLTPTNLRGPLPPFPGISTPMAPDDYPDYAFSYYQGGYEAGFTIWGPRMGDYLVERAVEVTGLLQGKPVELRNPQPLPMQYSDYGSEPFEVTATPEDVVGQVSLQPPARVARFESVTFAWLGGDPGAEMPQSPEITLQREEGGQWLDVIHENMRPYTNREPLIPTRLRLDEMERWEWVGYWEEIKDFPTGRYRFSVVGHRLDEAGARVAYQTESQTFEVVPSEEIEVSFVEGDAPFEVELAYPAAQPLVISVEGTDGAYLSGSYRMRHPDVATGTPSPLVIGEDVAPEDVTIRVFNDKGVEVITATGADVTLRAASRERDGRDGVPVTKVGLAAAPMLPAGNYSVTVEVVDPYGNTGSESNMVAVN